MRHFIFFAIFLFLASPLSVSAYVDPGTGSFIVQVLLAIIFGAVFYIKLSWRKIRALFSRSSSGKKDDRSQ